MTGYLISAVYGEIDTVSEALVMEHKALDQMTIDLHTQLAKATWVSQSESSFQDIMRRYDSYMAELHNELNRLAAALRNAGVNLHETDKYVASHTFGH
jgi:uncharacterized protein YukE